MCFALHGVSVRHNSSTKADTPALSDLHLSISAGEQIALIGPSGAGKTTLLHTLACAHAPVTGRFTSFGLEPWRLSSQQRHALRSRVFLAPQTPPLPARQRVVTAVLAGRLPQWSLWQAMRSLIKPFDTQAAYDALARFNLQDKLYARVDRLSGGERQRCGMARLLISQAEAFLVDEPLSALDPTLAIQTLKTLQLEAKTRNAVLICSLHQVELARAHFPRIIGLRDGRIVFDASRENLSDAMIEALYRNVSAQSSPDANTTLEDSLFSSITDTRCF